MSMKRSDWVDEEVSPLPLSFITAACLEHSVAEALVDLAELFSLSNSPAETLYWVSKPPSPSHDAPVGLSATLQDDQTYLVCIYTLGGCAFITAEAKEIRSGFLARALGLGNVSSQRAGKPLIQSSSLTQYNLGSCHFRRATAPELPAVFAEFRLQELSRINCAKVGVLYQSIGQTQENEFYCNDGTQNSPEYTAFLSWLGEHIKLKGYTGYRGGLDVKRDLTGPVTCAAAFMVDTRNGVMHHGRNSGVIATSDGELGRSTEVIFHVASMMPTSTRDEQQVEKKRHIGNDHLVIVFSDDGNTPLSGSAFTSNMLHSLVRVWPVGRVADGNLQFRAKAILKRGVAAGGPTERFSTKPFALTPESRDIFYTKLLQLQNSAWAAPELGVRIDGMRRSTLNRLLPQ